MYPREAVLVEDGELVHGLLPVVRGVSGDEVDFVIERGARVIPLEVKAGARPRPADIKGLRVFLEEYGKAAPHGVLLHTGTKAERVAERIWAIPLAAALGAS